ncbi:MAG TPA: HEPN domain-containing protein [Pirellulales bacterium]|nr:HEPN domain-containing protein [Pirellulales bacterium]
MRARSNLARGQAVIPEVCLEDLCFDAQQAAEKAVKAVCIHCGVRFPYVHNFKELLEALEKSGVRIPKYVWDADALSPFGVELRYPGFARPVTKRQHRRAVRIAEAVLRWAERQIAKT